MSFEPLMPDSNVIELTKRLQTDFSSEKIDLCKIRSDLEALLLFLASPQGRTEENCKFVDHYFMENDSWAECDLPDDLHDILADISSVLHDTCTAPDVAENFHSTPGTFIKKAETTKAITARRLCSCLQYDL